MQTRTLRSESSGKLLFTVATIVADCWSGQVYIQAVHGRLVGIMMVMGRLLSLSCPGILSLVFVMYNIAADRTAKQ